MKPNTDTEAQFLGEMPPMLAHKHGKRPERREVSKRWLASSVLVGITSFLLMGGALYAALEGREQLTVPGQLYEPLAQSSDTEKALKGNHPSFRIKTEEESNIMMVSTVSRSGGKNVVKVRPFLNVKSSMALTPRPTEKYPSFNALRVFSESSEQEIIAKSSDFMYGADVEGEVTLSVTDFPYQETVGKLKPRQHNTEIAQQIRAIAHNLEGGGAYVSALSYFNTQRFSDTDQLIFSTADITITPENVSVLSKLPASKYPGIRYEERNIKVRADAAISEILKLEGVGDIESSAVEDVLVTDLGSPELKSGDQLKTWFRYEVVSQDSTVKTIAKASVFRGVNHLVSIARNDNNRFVYAVAPDDLSDILESEKARPAIAPGKLPSVYNGIYRSALAEGLTQDLADALIKIFAFDLDFRSRISPSDELDVFVSLEDGQDKPNAQSEILYAGISQGKVKRRYYRFRDAETGRVDYYDETGKSAKKFLLRQPVPNGRFRSGFGMRRHPISRVYKLHAGVDWSAPRGTPILSAGNGVVTQAKWAGGYGRQTIIRHANGYETSYSHQTAYAKGIRPGVRVRQGQVIG
ncbi:MAG: M23 family metallopeptidase, partial [Pseudomonadota bacterium]